MDRVHGVVIGAGVVGLAVARGLALSPQGAGRDWLVLESESAIGTGTSSRNSEVIHAGINYPAGSLKARWCVRGKHLLYDYARERGVEHRRCGKLIVATSPEQVVALEKIRQRAAANGVDDLVLLSVAQARALEPELCSLAALHSPSTGIVDSHGLMLALQGDFENAGGMVAFQSALASARITPEGHVLRMADGTELACDVLVVASGLNAPCLMQHIEGLDATTLPQAYYCKGNYFTLSGRSPFSRLIYPVPEAAGLGVHLTIDLGGPAKFGPDVQWTDRADDLVVDPRRGDAFYAEVRKYWPGLRDGSLVAGYAGMRPKINRPDQPAADFMLHGPARHGHAGLVGLMGIESPGLTSSLAIAEAVVDAVYSI
ncbi:MAG: NAD(P)/FAD-dependent oxidoreductase [Alphaproteobacteria bacterium]|nr:NAD(P)/FAD-dependent oxidoreductase [Alphaproteobacteria bacterium]